MTGTVSVCEKQEECLLGLDLVNNWFACRGPRAGPNTRVLYGGPMKEVRGELKRQLNISGILGLIPSERWHELLACSETSKNVRMLLFMMVNALNDTYLVHRHTT